MTVVVIVPLNNEHWGFFLLCFLQCPASSCGVFLLCYREKDSAVPSLVDNDVEFDQLAKLFCFLPPSTASYKSHEKNTPLLAEVRTHP